MERKIILLLFFLLLSFSISSIIYETGSFFQFLMGTEPACSYDNWVSHVSEGLALPGYNAYPPWDRQTIGFGEFLLPESNHLQIWEDISIEYISQNWNEVQNQINLNDIPYDVVQFTDTDNNRVYYMMRERLSDYFDDNGTETTTDDESGSFHYGWGLYVYNPSATKPIIIVVPHPNDDYIAVPLAWKAFTQLDARYFFISGAGREVLWTNEGIYNNSKSISDPSRNPNHPLHLTYMKGCEDIRAILADSPSIIKREYSMQTHSYDSNLHIGFANCQISAGNGQNCVNLPIRDLSRTLPDMVNAAGYVIHPANTLGNNPTVLNSNFFTAYNSYHQFIFNDGTNQFNVPNYVDLPGYSLNNQMLYSIAGWNNFDVYDPFFHIEMDELPDCYPQTDSCLAWFYGWNPNTRVWDLSNRYTKVIAYYQPWVTALQLSLNNTFIMNDNQTPLIPVLSHGSLINNSVLRLNWQRAYEYDFHSWIVAFERRQYNGNDTYTIIDTLYYDRNTYPRLADQAATTIDISGFPLGFHYRVRMAAIDKSNRISGYSSYITIVTYASPPFVSNLRLKRSMTDNRNITIEWNAFSSSILLNSLRVERRITGFPEWLSIATLPPTQTSFTDSNFPNPSSLSYQYRIVTLGASGQVYTPSTFCEGFFRCYPAPVITSIEFLPANHVAIAWNPVTLTLNGEADTPDFYRIYKSTSLYFDTPDTYSFTSLTNAVNDAYDSSSIFQNRAFYKIQALANPVISRE